MDEKWIEELVKTEVTPGPGQAEIKEAEFKTNKAVLKFVLTKLKKREWFETEITKIGILARRLGHAEVTRTRDEADKANPAQDEANTDKIHEACEGRIEVTRSEPTEKKKDSKKTFTWKPPPSHAQGDALVSRCGCCIAIGCRVKHSWTLTL